MIRITIVEDESFMREELSLILRKAGYEVYEVQTFQKTYEEILKSHPDLVLLDVNLPGQSGFEICKKLKEKSQCPVMILTSRTQLKDEIHGLELGRRNILQNPFIKSGCWPGFKTCCAALKAFTKDFLIWRMERDFIWIRIHIPCLLMDNLLYCRRQKENFWNC